MFKNFSYGLNTKLFVTAFKKLFLFISLICPPFSQSQMHIEPYVGLSFTFVDSNSSIQEFSSQTAKAINHLKEGKYYGGFIPGVRIGYSFNGLAVGGDFSMGRWTSLYKEDFVPFYSQETITAIMPGLFVSYKLPLFVRFYAALIPKAPVQFASQKNGSRFCNKSKGAKIGVSYISLPFVNINFEYLPLHIYDENCSSWTHTGAVYANFIF